VKSKRRGKKTKYNNCIKSVTKSQHLAFGNFFSSENLQQACAQFFFAIRDINEKKKFVSEKIILDKLLLFY
jgi:hypothetical protein